MLHRDLHRLGVDIRTYTMLEKIEPGVCHAYNVWNPAHKEHSRSTPSCSARSGSPTTSSTTSSSPTRRRSSARASRALYLIGDAAAPRMHRRLDLRRPPARARDRQPEPGDAAAVHPRAAAVGRGRQRGLRRAAARHARRGRWPRGQGARVKIVVPVKQVAALDDEFELLDDGVGRGPRLRRARPQRVGRRSRSRRRSSSARPRATARSSSVTRRRRGGRRRACSTCLAKGADRARAGLGRRAAGRRRRWRSRACSPRSVERESPDLVLCGVQSSDAVNGATGVALAAHLGLPHVAVVKRLDYDAGAGTATVERELEGGLVEILRVRTAGAADDPDRHQRAALREPARDQAGAREAAGRASGSATSALDADAVAAARRLARRAGCAPPEAGEGAEMLEGSPADVGRAGSPTSSRSG